ncbi:MAG TPA: NAD-dependent epimerase/dehydratase family protein [Bryobacteraceae bacterium]|jgi:dTDP-glucose 4,6-dehydratase|nr:NAD-dependent epimerase/dehydratase family protein [Bryobacteraceae bacterium]
MTGQIPALEIENILAATRDLWEQMRGGRIFISGGTGFFGCWLLESFTSINRRLDLNATAVVLTRNPAAFHRKAPHLATQSSVELIAGDIRSFEFPAGDFPFLIHAATDADALAAIKAPLQTLDTIVEGTRRVLEFASRCGAKKLLFTSSGAVYGKQPSDLTHIPETYSGAPDPVVTGSAYGEGKRIAEMLCCHYGEKYRFESKIARCFAFAGPRLPLDGHFAIGNFVRDAMAGGPVRIEGDGTPYRSYLYAGDLAIWLWTILFRGKARQPYNVGSESEVTIAELAAAVVEVIDPRVRIEMAGVAVPGKPPLRYVPSTKLARTELGLKENIDLKEAILRMARWRRNEKGRE